MIAADLALARRLEAVEVASLVELAESYRRRFSDSEATFEPIAGGAAVFLAPGSPVNQAAGFALAEPITDDQLDQIERFFASRGESCAIEVCPLADSSLFDRLGERGYRWVGATNCVFRELDDAPAIPVGVRPIEDGERDEWARISSLGFGEGQPTIADIAEANGHLPSARHFVVERDGRLAGAGLVSFHGGAARLGGTAVLPEFRNHGLHRALIDARLAFVAEAGSGIVFSRATPGSASQRNLERAGFRIAYTRVRMVRPRA